MTFSDVAVPRDIDDLVACALLNPEQWGDLTEAGGRRRYVLLCAGHVPPAGPGSAAYVDLVQDGHDREYHGDLILDRDAAASLLRTLAETAANAADYALLLGLVPGVAADGTLSPATSALRAPDDLSCDR